MVRRFPSRVAAYASLLLAAFIIHGCKDSTAPTVKVPVTLVVMSDAFTGGGAAGAVTLTKAHLVAKHADATIALDTLVSLNAATAFRAAIRSVARSLGLASQTATGQMEFTFDVPLLHSTTAEGEDLSLTVDFLDAAGNVVFRAGPVNVHASETSPPSPVTVEADYLGTGSTAVSVEISPPSASVAPGGTIDFTATARDAGGTAIPGTPVAWKSDDPTVATVGATTGHVVAGAARGTTQIHVELVTGQSATATLVVQPAATTIALQSGDNQTGTAGGALAQPFVVKVTAADGLGVTGTAVTFAVTTGGGTLSAASATTDANGLASTTLTLGSVVGGATVTATVGGLSGSPVTFSATGTAGVATVLAFTAVPASGIAGANLAAVVVQARDALGNVATGYTGTVTLTLETPPTGVTLAGTTSVAAVAGVATFNAVRVSASGTGLQLRATGTGGVTSALSTAFGVTSAVATKLVLTNGPTSGVAGIALHFTLEARSADDAVATEYAGSLNASLLSRPTGGLITAVASAGFVSGVAVLDVTVNIPGTYVFDLASAALNEAFTGPIAITTLAIQTASGDMQMATANHAVPLPLVARTVDGFGNPVSGVTVNWSVVSGGGTVTPLSATSDVNGFASATWTLGAGGAQSVQAQAGAAGPTVAFTATIGPMIDLSVVSGGRRENKTAAPLWAPPKCVACRSN